MIKIKGKTLVLLVAMHEGTDEELAEKILQHAVEHIVGEPTVLSVDIGVDVMSGVDDDLIKKGLVKLIPLIRDGLKGFAMSKLKGLL